MSHDDGQSILEPGTLIDHFKVTRFIGKGAMGQVYQGRDEKLGRRVALKVIHPKYLGSDQAREGFLREARTTAQFSHPHIVTIYAVGEHHGQPYLAMEYLEGQNLRSRIQDDRSSIDVLRIGLAIAVALEEAHEHGVIHRDLKPENVVIPRDGRPRVLDFGLATLSEPSPRSETLQQPEDRPRRSGTPTYMAPEQWRKGESYKSSDIWALGVILHELIVGHRPFHEQESSVESLALRVSDADPAPIAEALKDQPIEHKELILSCIDKDPDKRPTASEVASKIRNILARQLRPTAKDQCPFPGLQPFAESQAALFHGREPETDAFLERFRNQPILPVVGPSGAGKSSFIQAGVIPRLKEQRQWIVVTFKPGTAPYRSLASALAECAQNIKQHSKKTISIATGESWLDWEDEQDQDRVSRQSRPSKSLHNAEKTAEQLIETPGLLGRILRRLTELEDAHVLLFVDQLEELYTLAEEDKTRRSFMEMICSAADDPRDPVRVVFTLRDDFLGRLAEGEKAREALSRLMVLRSPGKTALEQTLIKPLEAVGYRFDPPELAHTMVEAVRGEAASLPLIQFTARLLWEQGDHKGHRLTEETYKTLGGVEGALAVHADGVLEEMTPDQVGIARALFLRLITPDGTRRVVSREHILGGLNEQGGQILRRLIQARLVIVRRSVAEGQSDAELELAHESLIRSWKRLSRWFDESREDLAFLAQISQAAELWQERGRRDEEVWQDDALRDALKNINRLTDVPNLVREFLEAGTHQQQRKVRRRQQLFAASMIVLALIALGSIIFSLALAHQREVAQQQRALAERQQQRAEEQSAEALREGARTALLRGDFVQARAMLRASLETKVSSLGQALSFRLDQEPLLWQRKLSGDVDALSFSPDGLSVAALCDAPSVFVFQIEDMSQKTFRGHRQKPDAVGFSPDSRFLVSTSAVGTLRIWQFEQGLAESIQAFENTGGPLAFSDDGKMLAVGHRDGFIRLLTIDDEEFEGPVKLAQSQESASPIAALSYSSDRVAAGAMDGTTKVWNVRDRTVKATLQNDGAPVITVDFHPQRSIVATGSNDASVRMWNLDRPESPPMILQHSAAVRAVAFSPSGSQLATGTSDGTISIFDVRTGHHQTRFTQSEGQVLALDFSPDGQLLATGSTDQFLRIYRVDKILSHQADRGHTSAVIGVDFSRDGSILATGSNDGTIRLWDVRKGLQTRVFRGQNPSRITDVEFERSGQFLVASGADGHLSLWNVESGKQTHDLIGPTWYITALDFSPDQKLIATASYDGAIRLWDIENKRPPKVIYRHDAWATDVAFHPDGQKIASGGHDQVLRVWDMTRETTDMILENIGSEIHGLAFDQSGKRIAFSSGHEPVKLWNLENNGIESVGPSGEHIYWLDFYSQNNVLGLPSADRFAHIVSLDTKQEVLLRGHRGEVNYLRFSPDGKAAATTSDDGTVRLWDARSGQPLWRAPAFLSKGPQVYTQNGWHLFASSGPHPVEHISDGEKNVSSEWQRSVAQRSRLAADSEDGRFACSVTFDNQIEIWETDGTEPVKIETLRHVEDVIALSRGCISLAQGHVRLHDQNATRDLAENITSMAKARHNQVLVATGREIRLLDLPTGEIIRRIPSGSWIQVMLFLENSLVVGFGDGGLEVLRLSQTPQPPSFSFEGLPASPPSALALGPRRTLVAGFHNGFVGLLSLENGELLLSFQVHGSVRHLRILGNYLHVVSDLGDIRSLDLHLLRLDDCQLLRHIWREIPVRWHHGTPLHSPSPEDHRCSDD